MTRPAPAYTAFATHYDGAVGRQYFEGLRAAFDRLVPRYGMRFRTALDLGCGTGRFACHLARVYGASVLGVDNAPTMLAQARRHCADCRVGFMLQDLRRLDLPCRFDLATANFDVLNHLRRPAELQQLLRTVGRVVRPGGHFVFDLLTPAVARCLGPRRVLDVPLARGHVWQRLRIEPGGREIETTVQLLTVGSRAAPAHERHVERLYPVVEVAAGLADAGFVLRELLDAGSLRSAGREPARALFIARRRAP